MQPVTMILIHVPHASTHIPPGLRDDFLLTDDELAEELLRMTDRYTDEMARAMAASRRPVRACLRAMLSR